MGGFLSQCTFPLCLRRGEGGGRGGLLRRAGESGAHAGGYGFRLEGYGPLLSEGPYASKLHPGQNARGAAVLASNAGLLAKIRLRAVRTDKAGAHADDQAVRMRRTGSLELAAGGETACIQAGNFLARRGNDSAVVVRLDSADVVIALSLIHI